MSTARYIECHFCEINALLSVLHSERFSVSSSLNVAPTDQVASVSIRGSPAGAGTGRESNLSELPLPSSPPPLPADFPGRFPSASCWRGLPRVLSARQEQRSLIFPLGLSEASGTTSSFYVEKRDFKIIHNPAASPTTSSSPWGHFTN